MATAIESSRAVDARPKFRSIAVPPGVVAAVAIGAAAATLIEFDLSARGFVMAFFSAVVVVIAAIDLERRLVPNRIVLPASAIVLFGNIAAEPDRAREWTIAASGSMLVALVISLATRGGVGMGDVKLAFLLGAGLGSAVVGAVVVATLATLVVALMILGRNGLQARKETIPLAPFLALGALVSLFLS